MNLQEQEWWRDWQLLGPGVIVTLNDSKRQAGQEKARTFLVHDNDILQVVNGCLGQAVSVNGQRMIALLKSDAPAVISQQCPDCATIRNTCGWQP